MHFTTRSFLGHTDDLAWSQYWENEPDDPNLFLHRGHLFALVNLSVEDGLASDVGHLLINEVNQIYFSSVDVSSPIWLKRTLETIGQNPVFQSADISLMVAVVLDGYLHLCFLNSGVGIFHRQSKISKILSSSVGEVQQISGKIQPGDQFMICTSAFLDSYGWDKIKTYLSGASLQDIEESFLFDLSSFADQSYLGGLLVQIQDDALPESVSVDEVAPTSPPPVHLDTKDKKNLFQKLFPKKSVYVSHLDTDSSSKRKKINILFSILVLVALFVSIFFGAKRNKITKTENEYQTLKSQYQTKMNNALAVKNLNLDESQKQARESKGILTQMSLLKIHLDEVEKFKTAVDSLLSQTGSADTYNPVSFYDTTLIGASAHYSRIFLDKTKLYLLDTDTGRIDNVDIINHSLQKILPTNANGAITSFAVDNGVVYVLKDGRVYAIVGQGLVQKVELSSQIPGFAGGSFRFWNGSLYVLAKLTDGSSNIWKFTPNSTGFGTGVLWTKDAKGFPASATSFAINGQVWVVGKNGQIVPFTRGVADVYKSSTSLTSADNLVTSLDSEVLALTDKGSIVYVYHKTDPAVSGYNFNKRKILSLAFDGSSNTIFVLCDDQHVYQIKL